MEIPIYLEPLHVCIDCVLFEDTTEITTVKENTALTAAIESTLFDHE